MATNNYATKTDVKRLEKSMSTQLREATDAILDGMDSMFKQQDKRNDEKFATKADLKKIETKVDFLRQDVKDLEGELVKTPTRAEVDALKSQVFAT